MHGRADARSQLRADLEQRLATLSPAKRALALRGLRSVAADAEPRRTIPRRDDAASAPLSFAQELLWLLDRSSPGMHAYNVSRSARLRGPLDLAALGRALDAIVVRHTILRSTFEMIDGEARQIVREARPVPIEIVDVRRAAGGDAEAAARRAIAHLTRRPFDLERDLQLRASLVRIADDDAVLLLESHHIASDGWSRGVLLRELSVLYAAFHGGRAVELLPLTIQYGDYAAWQRATLAGERLDELTSYWREQLDGVPVLDLPTDRPPPVVPDFEGGARGILIPREVLDGVSELSRAHQATTFMTLLAAFQSFLARYCAQDDVVVGSPIAGRANDEVAGLIGYFVNTLVFRARLADDPTFTDLLARTRETCLGAYEHQDMPYEKLVLELQSSAHARTPLVRAMFTMQDAEPGAFSLDGLSAESFGASRGAAKFDLALFVKETDAGLRAELQYRTQLFDDATIERMLRNFAALLASIVRDPSARVSRLEILDPAERDLIASWNATATAYPRDASIAEVFAAQVAAAPDAPALAHDGPTLTYRELDERANRLAQRLQRLGVGRDSLVGLCAARSVDAVVGALGILKAGGAYVPLDPGYPAERLAFITDDTALSIVVSTSVLAGVLPPLPHVILLDADAAALGAESPAAPPCPADADSLAYVIYTSGSTGVPKGVAATQRGVVRLVCGARYAHLGPDEVVLGFAPLTFDASTFELWGPLLNGGTIALFGTEAPTLEDLGDAIRRHGVTTLWLTAALFHQMVDRNIGALRGLRQLLAGGDVLSVPHVKRALAELSGTQLINGYGPTENTTFTTCFRVPADWDGPTVPIGRPIENTTVYVVDPALQPVPIGVAGRLYAGGDGVARGYHARPELTAERFIPDPFSARPGARMYDTGDRVRRRADGTIEFLGRADQQLKIRGFRVEPGEIETMLMQHPAVQDAVVVGRDDVPAGLKRLIGYVVPRAGASVHGEELRAFVAGHLPSYLVPSVIVPMAAFPVTANGKLDRALLPPPEDTIVERGVSVAPRTPAEEKLAQIWREVMHLERVGITESFLELGGDSLLAMRLISRIGAAFDRRITVRMFFENATIAGLAGLLGDQPRPVASPLIPVRTTGSAPPFFYLHGDFGAGDYHHRVGAQLDAEQPFYVLAPHGTDGRPLPATVEAMARDYVAILKETCPKGPYVLGGFCASGLVAFEMARQLEQANETVTNVVLLDVTGINGGMAWFTDPLVRIARALRIPEPRYLALLAALGRFALRFRRARRFWRGSGLGAAFRRAVEEAVPSTPVEEKLPLEADWRRLQAGYMHRRYGGRVTLLSVTNGRTTDDLSTRGWRAVARSVDLIPLRGTHLACINENLEHTATTIAGVLRSTVQRSAQPDDARSNR